MITSSELLRNLYNLTDQVVLTGISIEVKRKNKMHSAELDLTHLKLTNDTSGF